VPPPVSALNVVIPPRRRGGGACGRREGASKHAFGEGGRATVAGILAAAAAFSLPRRSGDRRGLHAHLRSPPRALSGGRRTGSPPICSASPRPSSPGHPYLAVVLIRARAPAARGARRSVSPADLLHLVPLLRSRLHPGFDWRSETLRSLDGERDALPREPSGMEPGPSSTMGARSASPAQLAPGRRACRHRPRRRGRRGDGDDHSPLVARLSSPPPMPSPIRAYHLPAVLALALAAGPAAPPWCRSPRG
jgi:hypothetical protein